MARADNGLKSNKHLEATLIQVTALGDIASGKSTILKRIWQGGSEPLTEDNPFDYRDSVVKCLPVPIEGKQVWMNVELYDSSGMESNGLLTSSFYRKKDGVILVWNSCDARTLESLVTWEEDLRHYYVDQEYPALVVFANKFDQSQLNERLYSDYVQRYLARNISCYKTNAMTGEGVKEGFDQLLRLMGNKLTQSFARQYGREKGMQDSIHLDDVLTKQSRESPCCN